MRFSLGIFASALLLNAVYAEVSVSAASASAVEEYASASAVEEYASASVVELEALVGNLEKRNFFDFFKNMFYDEEESSVSEEAASASAVSFEKREASESWSGVSEEASASVSETRKHRKHRHYRRDESVSSEASVSSEEELFEASLYNFASVLEADAFAPVSQAYVPVYYRRGKYLLTE